MKSKFYLSSFTLICLFVTNQSARAQTYQPSNRTPISDNTLGTQVSGSGNSFNITGGLNKGQALFHSFTDFSIPTNGAANFNRPTGNQSIITRVTGNLFSDINGSLNTNGANFLLINPNGVVFGPGVKLDVGKAFVASTASGIDFVDAAGRNYNFGVNRAGDAPLLSIDPNVAFNPAKLIMNASISGSRGIENYGTLTTENQGQYIGLIGGDVKFNGGKITTAGAKIELGGLVQSGIIDFSLDNGVLFPANVERGNVSLVSNGTVPSLIELGLSGIGSVFISAKDITLKGADTKIRAGIGFVSSSAKVGDIKLNATGNVNLSDYAAILNTINGKAVGKGGGIEIIARNLSVNGALLSTAVGGMGGAAVAGNIKITATDDVFFNRASVLSGVTGSSEGVTT